MYAGRNEFYRWGHKMISELKYCLKPNEQGFYSIETQNGKYWELGTSQGKYGEYIKIGDTFFSVNKLGYAWAKVGTEKGEKFVYYIKKFINNCLIQHYGEEDAVNCDDYYKDID